MATTIHAPMTPTMDANCHEQPSTGSSAQSQSFKSPPRAATVMSTSSGSTVLSVRHSVTLSGLYCRNCGTIESVSTLLRFSTRRTITNSPKCLQCNTILFNISGNRVRRGSSYQSTSTGSRSNSDPIQAEPSQSAGVTTSDPSQIDVFPAPVLGGTRVKRLTLFRTRAGKFISRTRQQVRRILSHGPNQRIYSDLGQTSLIADETTTHSAFVSPQFPPQLSRIVEDLRSEPNAVLSDPQIFAASPTESSDAARTSRAGSPLPTACKCNEKDDGERRQNICSAPCQCSHRHRDSSSTAPRCLHCSDSAADAVSQRSQSPSAGQPQAAPVVDLLTGFGHQFEVIDNDDDNNNNNNNNHNNILSPPSDHHQPDSHRCSFASDTSTVTPDQPSGTPDGVYQSLPSTLYGDQQSTAPHITTVTNGHTDSRTPRSSFSYERAVGVR